MRALERRFANDLPDEFTGLMDVWRWASMGGRVPKMGPEHPAFFYALRGSQHRDRDLVNMLLTDLSRLDFRQLFIMHKPLFYQRYREWSEGKKDFVVRFLEQEYAMDKAGARDALFGAEPSMVEKEPVKIKYESSASWASSQREKSIKSEDIQYTIENSRGDSVTMKVTKPYVSPWGRPDKKYRKGRKRR